MAVVGSILIPYRNYRHTVEHENKLDLQAEAALMMKPKTPIILPNLDKKLEEKAPEKGAAKELQKPVDQPPPSEPPADQEQPKPFTFWAYVSRSETQPGIPAIHFVVKSCSVGRTSVTCVMTATSSRYDRQLEINIFATTITDSEGDVFRAGMNVVKLLQLDRESPLPWKLEFPVNKNVVEPLVVRINGFVPSQGILQNATFDIN